MPSSGFYIWFAITFGCGCCITLLLLRYWPARPRPREVYWLIASQRPHALAKSLADIDARWPSAFTITPYRGGSRLSHDDEQFLALIRSDLIDAGVTCGAITRGSTR